MVTTAKPICAQAFDREAKPRSKYYLEAENRKSRSQIPMPILRCGCQNFGIKAEAENNLTLRPNKAKIFGLETVSFLMPRPAGPETIL